MATNSLIYIDVVNLSIGFNQMYGGRVDYQLLLDKLNTIVPPPYKEIKAYGYNPNECNSFVTRLEKLGITTIFKVMKDNLHFPLIIADILMDLSADVIDNVIIVTGHKIMSQPIKGLKHVFPDVKFIVAAPAIAQTLANVADQAVVIEEGLRLVSPIPTEE